MTQRDDTRTDAQIAVWEWIISPIFSCIMAIFFTWLWGLLLKRDLFLIGTLSAENRKLAMLLFLWMAYDNAYLRAVVSREIRMRKKVRE